MSDHQKPQPQAQTPHMEKPIMDQPQEEFVGDEAQPSKDVSEVREAEENQKSRKSDLQKGRAGQV